MKKLPLGIQSFRKIIDGGYVYADKTGYVYDLINDASYYFLSRPRRFGKSLLLDTIAEAFSGDRELFKGLFIYDSGYAFEKHPVLRFDMSNIANKTPEILEDSISKALLKQIEKENLDIDYDIPSEMFKTLIEALHKKYGKRVVVLIDEYDKPILDRISDIETAEANRDVLRGFYGILKSMDPHLRFTLITGITKFTKTSVFSGLNNLYDITMTGKYANICGIPTVDLGKYFCEHIDHLARLDKFKHYGSLHQEICLWYDGYSWDGVSKVINPFSLLNFFCDESFESYWYMSGTPTFLINLVKSKPSSFLTLKTLEISKRSLDTFDIQRMSIVPLLFQTGYLTVDEERFTGGAKSYLLKMPNHEVKEAFYLNIIADFTDNDDNITESAYWRIKASLETGDLQHMLEALRGLFASIPYQLHISREAYYHSIFCAIMNLLGFDIDAETSVSGGRVDAVLALADKVYIIEFKYEECPPDAGPEEKRKRFDKALDEGMKQIKDRGYAKKYAGSGKDIYQAAFAFLGRDDIEVKLNKLPPTDG